MKLWPANFFAYKTAFSHETRQLEFALYSRLSNLASKKLNGIHRFGGLFELVVRGQNATRPCTSLWLYEGGTCLSRKWIHLTMFEFYQAEPVCMQVSLEGAGC